MTDEEKLKALEALRGKHDQTVRTRAIEILHGPSTAEQTETERFLEAEIFKLKERLR
jgi:hypothetical protein